MKSTTHAVIATMLVVLILVVGCGPAQPTATPVPPADTPVPSTATPAPPTDTPVPPTDTPVPPADTPLPPTATPVPPTRTPRPTPTPRPPLSGSGGGVLAFVQTGDRGWGIYVINADGSDQRRILYDREGIAYPEWSPDGSQIAFHKHQSDQVWSINVMDADGDNEKRLTNTETRDAAPVWSPDGSQIAFARGEDIWLMNADGTEQRLLMDDPVAASGADWSPDGSQILFESGRDGNAEIYVMEADGSNLRRLTNNEAEDWWPTWSPDGSQIAFMSTLDGDWEIYVMNADGGDLRQLTENSVDDTDPAWSPDGTRIAFVSNRDTGLPNDTEIYVMNADGSDPQRITETSGFEWGVDWRPDISPETSEPATTPTAPSAEVEGLRITIIYDNYLQDERLTAEWGFAALVEYDDHVLLFDTGGTAALMDNMHLLGIDPKTIEAVVLSHEHADHLGGLLPLLAEADQPTVYLLASFPADFKNSVAALTDVVEVTRSMEIFTDIYTTGEVAGEFREQALAIRTDEGTVIVTGCAHPGIARMVRRGRSSLQPGADVEYAPVALVVGGFHLVDQDPDQIERVIADLQSLNVQRASPTHCSGDGAIAMFAEAFGDQFVPGGAGGIILLPDALAATPIPPSPTPLTDGLPDLARITVENADRVQLLATLRVVNYSMDQPWHGQCGVAFSPDGSLLIGTCEKNALPVWDMPSLDLRHRLFAISEHTVSCDFRPDGQMVACGRYNYDYSIPVWDPNTGEYLMDVGKHRSPVWEVDFSPDGQLLASCSVSSSPSQRGDTRLWRVSPPERLWTHDMVYGECISVSFHPSGDTIAASGIHGHVEILDVETGDMIILLEDATRHIGDLTFSPSGTLLAAGCDDHNIFIWDTTDYHLVTKMSGHQSYVNGVVFSSDETYLVSGSDDKTVAIWALDDFRMLKQLTGHQDTILRVDLNSANTLIASISWDATVRLWGVIDQ